MAKKIKKTKSNDTEAKKYQDQVKNPIPEVTEVTRKIQAEESKNKASEIEKQLELQKLKLRAKNSVKEW